MKIHSNMRIGVRLAIGFMVVLALSTAITVVGIVHTTMVADAAQKMVDEPIQKERLASDWFRNIEVSISRTTASAKSADPSLAPYFAQKAAELTKSNAAVTKKLESLLTSDTERQDYAKAMAVRKAFIEGRDEVFKLKEAGKSDEANLMLERRYIPAAEAYQGTVRAFLDTQRASLDQLSKGIARLKDESRNRSIVLACLGIALGVASAAWLTLSITRPLSDAVASARRVAAGDLTGNIEVRNSDELGHLQQALRDMNGDLRSIVGTIREGTGSIATASSQISHGIHDLSLRTEQQASSLEETASSMEELAATVKQNAENAQHANTLAITASEVARHGGEVVSQVVTTMGDIDSAARAIAEIIGIINGIAFQTNILALNAAVEAARAGDQGRGFAVVASEVRTLAQRSASAAKQITELVGNSVEKVAGGTRLVSEAGETMREVMASVHQVTDIMAEIAAASDEQRAGIEQMNQAVVILDHVTQQNAALVEQAAAASDSMREQSLELSRLVDQFKLSDEPARTAVG